MGSQMRSNGFVETESGLLDIGQFLMLSVTFLVLVVGNDFAISAASVQRGGELPVHPACIVCMSEFAKAVVSLVLWLGKGRPVLDAAVCEDQVRSSAFINTGLLMLIPATIYSLSNMLSLFTLSKIHIAHVAVLRPTGVAVFNCLLWFAVFGRAGSGRSSMQQKVFGITLCILGGIVNSYDFHGGGLAVDLQAGLFLIVSTFLSAFGAVTNEFVLKYRLQLSIDLQNLCLYVMTFSITLVFLVASGGSPNLDFAKALSTPEVRVMVVYNAVMGLNISRILKQMGSVSKMVLGILREPIEVMIAPFFVVSELSTSILLSTILALMGGLLYFLPPEALVSPRMLCWKKMDSQGCASV